MTSIAKLDADEVTLAPDHLAFPDRAEVVERQIKFQRHYAQASQPDACAAVRYVPNSASENAGLPDEEKQSTLGNFGSAYRSAVARDIEQSTTEMRTMGGPLTLLP